MAGLAVNIDRVATLREASQAATPDPIAAALLAELAGADGIVCHLREDRRTIQDRDVRLLRRVIQTQLILEMVATSEMVGIALDVRPERVTLVPESRQEVASDGSLDLIVHSKSMEETIGALQNNGIPVNILINPEPEQIKLAHQAGANGIAISTKTFCEATGATKQRQAFAKIIDAVKLAKKLKLDISAGRGLDITTIKAFTGVTEINTYYIGHSIVSRAVLVGMDRAVRDMRDLINGL
ncbi:pyridoxine 5'-phosphate synthase [Desulfosarcina ovata subsp. sediminis]|uniref:Pyridoxine 5'-phosphate synthase n=1 Tax=Desulfosarcina ovata subsp. sediminis TaxID=885957 RepID=A0A5K7ZH04_9BACT|nr:pyridoxine 5'-phosphate synthase [Desulfosarcina ovata]BBO80624.1 pyridoxine 5'-phosphate synthase [Desulfosarcina ovata subsp. sediminis]